MKIRHMEIFMPIGLMKKERRHNISYRQGRQQWFSVCIVPSGLLIDLTGNRPQSASDVKLRNVMCHIK